MMPVNLDLKTSFEFPKKLTIEAYDSFQLIVNPAFEKYRNEHGTMSIIRYQAIHFRAAVKTGLIKNWQSGLMPKSEPSEDADVHVGVIEWAGQEVIDWLGAQKAIPKVSFWRSVQLWIGMARLRRNLSKVGAVKD